MVWLRPSRAQGLPEPRRIIDGEWAALVWDSIN